MPPAESRSATHGESAKGSRRRSRELALQALYQWLLTRQDGDALYHQAIESREFSRADKQHFEALVRGAIDNEHDLDAAIQPFLDRPAQALSPVEHALLLIGSYELINCPEIPYRVVINEAVEVAKIYGGTDGHKYVNGVLDKLSAQVRPTEARKK